MVPPMFDFRHCPPCSSCPPCPVDLDAEGRGAGRCGLKKTVNVLFRLALCLWLASRVAWAFDINQADARQLQSLNGIGPKLADRVLKERAKGAFRDFDDLSARVKGIGAARIRQWRAAGVVVSPPARPMVTTTPKPTAGRQQSSKAAGKLAEPGAMPSDPSDLIPPSSRPEQAQRADAAVEIIQGGRWRRQP